MKKIITFARAANRGRLGGRAERDFHRRHHGDHPESGRGFHFQSGSLDDCNGIDIPNWTADAAGLPTPISPTPTLALLL